ncbi:MAG: UDP-N-acetylmuramoyl-L-alanine--D-glutamate ligase [Bacteroidetes bacterium]|uniref:UDP-N-acetylmuramoylalanine--D-glutamate ligase n=1 Tax=Phaeocystidibacter marisrubri TaxID=1577780 RepID=A0A6L3ZH73_9FLAO|nr:UDP-N-acetylmuramoyl-L-alanine--D-glutamate ligase [Phaeocystidibacter marisrubri]KAB2816835.1 UDP-N-acetylmuramoyl-L-alanine--D-glutamate ligase [Phaeocystidibacter marisrubri]TNE29684.1 MAG: UDP-N-acetylmuramoyl-L-alanine--D-glutamate ligase [Bacteroidota bacterium]GGH77945.1 UDP-N-acetylmuramoylalanine--D-glutamate ligase [Phaeocystidibacter marisrubri]
MGKKSLNITVLGAGESGVGAAILAVKLGHQVFVSDGGPIKDSFKAELDAAGIEYEENGHDKARILKSKLVIKSPGIPEKAAIIKAIRQRRIEVISEIEFAYRNTDATIVAVTGSNGKTTTASLIYHIYKKAGLNVGLGGNIGNSFAKMVAEDPKEIYVLEISSFQLDDCVYFAPYIAILTNITPDHLDRYDYKLENYVDSKFRIIQKQEKTDHFIYCADDPETLKAFARKKIKSNAHAFSYNHKVDDGAYWNEEQQHITLTIDEDPMNIEDLALQGKHNAYNSMAAGMASRLLNIRKETIRESLSDFDALEHRLEPVMEIHGVEFINDSKATNVNSTFYALESMKKNLVWIVGGVDKGNDYEQLIPMVGQKVKAIVCLGKDVSKIHTEFEGVVETITDAHSMKEAVTAAYKLATKGDAVLLSPACASFDLFENYEDRGRQFKEEVRNL